VRKKMFFILTYSTMSEYEQVNKLGFCDNFKGLKSTAKVQRHKLFVRNKLSTPTVQIHIKILTIVREEYVWLLLRSGKNRQHMWPATYFRPLGAVQKGLFLNSYIQFNTTMPKLV
jgi:hypothetical protein